VLPEPLQSFLPAVAFTYGALIGSFLNVVIYRLPRGDEEKPEERLWISRPAHSFCPHCKVPIRAYDNIPIISYFVLAGKCRKCKAKIPFRYFFVELFTALLFAIMATRHEDALLVGAIYTLLSAALIACTFIDIDLRIIPDKIDIPGMYIAPIIAALVPDLHRHRVLNTPPASQGLIFSDLEMLHIPIPFGEPRVGAVICSLLGILVGAGVIWTIGVVGSRVFRKEAMGFGDVKLLGMIGGFLGWQGVLLALLIGCLVGAVIGVIVKLATEDPYIPFGPFLSLGALALMLARYEVVWTIFEWYPRWVARWIHGQ
jgi:leader peptidase (prepilin peptidase)/N-methyltransferase